jgi:hypothetical protein
MWLRDILIHPELAQYVPLRNSGNRNRDFSASRRSSAIVTILHIEICDWTAPPFADNF